jgi:hypothetical protein
MSDQLSRVVVVELSTGTSIPLRPTTSKKTGNLYHAVLKSGSRGLYDPGKYGVKVAPSVVGGSLPNAAKVEGISVKGERGRTATSDNEKVTFSANVKVDGQERRLRLSISKLPDGNFNVSGVLARPGGSKNAAPTSSL